MSTLILLTLLAGVATAYFTPDVRIYWAVGLVVSSVIAWKERRG